MNTKTLSPSGREEIEQLLPWHVAGTLSRGDAQRVEQALAHDPSLALSYRLAREEFAETILLNENLGAPSARAMDRLLAGIEADQRPNAAKTTRSSFSFGRWFSDSLASLSPRTLSWAATGAVLAITLQAGMLASLYTADRDEGGTRGIDLSRPAEPVPAPAAAMTGSFALMSFAPQATIAQITSFLGANQLTMVDGPRAGGFYRVRVAPSALPKDEVSRITTRLQSQNDLVRFAEPSE